MRCYHATPQENVESIMENGLVPQIGQLSSLLGEKKERVYMFPTYDDCENALLNWLGMEYDDLEEERGEFIPVVTLEIDLPDDFPLESEVGFEVCSSEVIPPEWITFYKYEG